eukprot:8501754-Karenia_brevis.AAC.1
MRASELCKEDLSVRADGTFALDSIVTSIMLEPRLQALLFPLQNASGKGDRDEEVDRLRDEVQRL